MSHQDNHGKYAHSIDGELYLGAFETERDAALAGAEHHEEMTPHSVVYVGRLVRPDIAKLINGYSILENIGERAYDEYGEAADGWLCGSPRSEKTINVAAIEKAIADYIAEHEPPEFYGIEDIREFTAHEIAELQLQEDAQASGQRDPITAYYEDRAGSGNSTREARQ